MITTRNAREDEWELLAEIGFRSWESAMSKIGETTSMAANAYTAFRSFTMNTWLTITVVENAGSVVGWAARERLDENISDFWIDPAHHRQGFGKVLLASVEAEMAQQGLDKAAAQTHARNARAVSFFESQGYRIHWLSVAYSARVDRDIESVGLTKQLQQKSDGTYGPGF